MQRFRSHTQGDTSPKMGSRRLSTVREYSKIHIYLGLLYSVMIYMLAGNTQMFDEGIFLTIFRPSIDALFTILPIVTACDMCHTMMLRIKMCNERQQNIQLASNSSGRDELNSLSLSELRTIFVYSAIYGVVHSTSIAAVIFYHNVLGDKWYYPMAYWTALVGMFVFGVLLYLWSNWRKVH